MEACKKWLGKMPNLIHQNLLWRSICVENNFFPTTKSSESLYIKRKCCDNLWLVWFFQVAMTQKWGKHSTSPVHQLKPQLTEENKIIIRCTIKNEFIKSKQCFLLSFVPEHDGHGHIDKVVLYDKGPGIILTNNYWTQTKLEHTQQSTHYGDFVYFESQVCY